MEIGESKRSFSIWRIWRIWSPSFFSFSGWGSLEILEKWLGTPPVPRVPPGLRQEKFSVFSADLPGWARGVVFGCATGAPWGSHGPHGAGCARPKKSGAPENQQERSPFFWDADEIWWDYHRLSNYWWALMICFDEFVLMLYVFDVGCCGCSRSLHETFGRYAFWWMIQDAASAAVANSAVQWLKIWGWVNTYGIIFGGWTSI